MRDCHLPDRWETIIRSLCDGTCVAVTDGSYDPDSRYATACWIIEGEGESQCKGASHTSGNDDELDAYRAEIFGIYCVLICIKYILQTYDIDNGSITIVCDCFGTLTRAIIYDNHPTTRHPSFDLL